MNQTELNASLEKAIEEVKGCGLKVSDSILHNVFFHHKPRLFGYCANYMGHNAIYLNEEYAKTGNEYAIHSTLVHEVLHTIPGGNCHTGEWKRGASLVNKKYGYHIKRCGSVTETGNSVAVLSDDSYKYELKCTGCGHIYGFKRLSKHVLDYSHCTCSLCHSKLVRVK